MYFRKVMWTVLLLAAVSCKPGVNHTADRESFLFQIDSVVLDPGHGGTDKGAASDRGVLEKKIVLDYALRLKKKLEKAGIKVFMTRERDQHVSLLDRVRFANDSGADLFISIHANAASNKGAEGFEVFYVADDGQDQARAVKMMNEFGKRGIYNPDLPQKAVNLPVVWDLINSENRRQSMALAQAINEKVNDHQLSKSRGVKLEDFFVLKWADKPAVLLELGFLTHRYEARRLKNSRYRDKLVQAVYEGILKFKGDYENSQGFTVA